MLFVFVAGTGIEPVNSLLYYKTNITHFFLFTLYPKHYICINIELFTNITSNLQSRFATTGQIVADT